MTTQPHHVDTLIPSKQCSDDFGGGHIVDSLNPKLYCPFREKVEHVEAPDHLCALI